MTEKRFELEVNNNGQVDIVDWYESKKKNAICIYNDLGVIPFSSASSLCDLLNQLNDENEQLRLQLNSCSDQRNEFHRGARENANRVGKLKKENEQLKADKQALIDFIRKEFPKSYKHILEGFND